MTDYRFLTAAQEEMEEAAMFYEAASIGLGGNFLDDVQHVTDILRKYPESGVEVTKNLRRVLLHRFPFSLIYSIDADGILIVSVAHNRRRPSYWKSRL